MRSLTEVEKAKIITTLSSLTRGKSVSGICVYGSQVAGYARSDSDYDAIVALSPFRQKIKYFYLNGGVEVSALVIDPKTLANDCARSALGEFVSGRFLNPYEAIIGKDFFQENESIFKKRVILEGLLDAVAEYSEFAFEMEFQLAYFLYDKLRKRAAIYPPVVYSYSQTYGEKLKDENVESSLAGFRAAATALQSEGIVSATSKDFIRLDRTRAVDNAASMFKAGFGTKVSVAASYTSKSIRQYAVHGYAGRVTPMVVGKEIASKLTRLRTPQSSKLPEEIRFPKVFWSLREGRLFVRSEAWINDVLGMFQMSRERAELTEKPMGEIYTASNFYSFNDGVHILEIVAKRYKDFKAMKWGILSVWSLRNANFSANSTVRLAREYHALNEFRKFGLHTPSIIAVFLPQEMLVTRFIHGKDLSSLQSAYLEGETEDLTPFRDFGEILATLHLNKYCMGDTKPSNAVLADDDREIYLTDLEQAHAGGNPAWDVAEYVYYSVRFTMKEDRARRLVDAFFQGYTDDGHNEEALETLKKTMDLRYRAPFQAFIAPNVLNSVIQEIKNQPS